MASWILINIDYSNGLLLVQGQAITLTNAEYYQLGPCE